MIHRAQLLDALFRLVFLPWLASLGFWAHLDKQPVIPTESIKVAFIRVGWDSFELTLGPTLYGEIIIVKVAAGLFLARLVELRTSQQFESLKVLQQAFWVFKVRVV